jgi:hypothetical protein
LGDEQRQLVLHERLARDRDHHLRYGAGPFPEAGPETAGEDYTLHY